MTARTLPKSMGRGTSAKSWNNETMLHRLTEHHRHLEAAADRSTLTHQQRSTASEAAETIAWAIQQIKERGHHDVSD